MRLPTERITKLLAFVEVSVASIQELVLSLAPRKFLKNPQPLKKELAAARKP
jgi:hypothetical protein